MASQSQGIQQLLQAEKRAAEKVAEARKRECGAGRAARGRGRSEPRLGPARCWGLGPALGGPAGGAPGWRQAARSPPAFSLAPGGAALHEPGLCQGSAASRSRVRSSPCARLW
ncbi:hypothetical protein LUU34_00593500 [Aix galericulata]|nr:hypothetical protein LUU34_00593500 [Aix galericulata]